MGGKLQTWHRAAKWGCWRAAQPPTNTPKKVTPLPRVRGEGVGGWGRPKASFAQFPYCTTTL